VTTRIACWFAAGLVSQAALAWAGELPKATPTPLEQRLEDLAQVDRELEDAQRQLSTSIAPRSRRRLKTRIQELRVSQERLLREIEQFVGPLPPAVQQEPTTPLEDQVKTQQRHHEAILESDVARRLPSQ
jgi:hypothetical protein